MKKILYIHGFNSGPGNKVIEFEKAGFKVICPQLTNNVDKDIKTLTKIALENATSKLHIVGTSLGGYYALVLSDILKSKDEYISYHLINPSLKPYESLKRHLGETLNNYKTNETFTVTETFLNDLKKYQTFLTNSKETNFNKRTFYFGMADTVINNVATIMWISKHTKIHNYYRTQQDHRFKDIKVVLDNIEKTQINKKIIYVDMDGVLVDYKHHDDGKEHKKGAFLEMKPVKDAIESFNSLSENPLYDVYILSTAPWDNTSSWEEKRLWVEKYIGKNAYKRLILSHNKHLNAGDYLIDDRLKNGSEKFTGKLLHFGKGNEFKNWKTVMAYLKLSHSEKICYEKDAKEISIIFNGTTETSFIYKNYHYDIITDDDYYPYQLIKRGKYKEHNITFDLLTHKWAKELVELVREMKFKIEKK